MKTELLRLDDVTCRLNGVDQLSHFNLQVCCGEVVGLLAVNAHGTDTLLSLLQFNTPIHFGRVYFEDRLVASHIYCGRAPNPLAVIGPESRLIDSLSVADNILALSRSQSPWLVNRRQGREYLRTMQTTLDVYLPYSRPAEELTFFERCIAELLKAAVSGARLIVLRDIGHYLAGDDLERLHGLIARLAARGTAFLYLSSDSGELSSVCSRMAVLYNGTVVKVLESGQMSGAYVARLVRSLTDADAAPVPQQCPAGPVCFSMHGVFAGALRGVELEVHAGECVAIGDEDGTFAPVLRRLAAGEERCRAGQILLDGRPVRGPLARCRGFAYAAENPAASMLFGEMDCLDNLAFSVCALPVQYGAVRRSLRMELSAQLGGSFSKRMSELTLSEQYALLFARIRLQRPRIVFCEHPFFGSDVCLRGQLAGLVQSLLQRGIAVVVISAGRSAGFPAAGRSLRFQGRKLLPGEPQD